MFPYYPQQQTYPYNQMRQPTMQSLNGRMVTNVEEARASQIDLDGSQWYFPCPSEGKIYTKTINMQGLPVFNVYKLDTCQALESNPLNMLTARVTELEKIVKEMKEHGPLSNDESITTQPTAITK